MAVSGIASLKTQTGIAQPARTPEENIQVMLKAEVPRIQRLFQDPRMTARFVQLAMMDMRKVPKLLKCNTQSILGCMMQAASLGLYFGMNGQCFMVPYGSEATFVTGWRGHVTLALRGNNGAELGAKAVRQGDEFDYSDGSKPFIHHKTGGEREAPITHFWAKSLQPGARHINPEVWTASAVERHRERFNKVGSNHYSYANPESWEAYGCKVPLLQAIKLLPVTYESAMATQLDYAADRGVQKLRPETVEAGVLPDEPTETEDGAKEYFKSDEFAEKSQDNEILP